MSQPPSIKIRFDLPESIAPIIRYTFDVLTKHFQISFEAVENEPQVTIGVEDGYDIHISNTFVRMIDESDFRWSKCFLDEPVILCDSGHEDNLGTAFYMLNSLQEYSAKERDKFGRYPFQASYQNRFDCVKQDLVAANFDKIRASVPALSAIPFVPRKSSIFLSHDIDRVYGSLRTDGFTAFKKLRIDVMLHLLFNALVQRPDWLRIDKIMALETSYDVRSTFFWMVKQGATDLPLRNADYKVGSPQVQRELTRIQQSGFEIGLHKSVSSFSYTDELARLPMHTAINRNHFLMMDLPNTYKLFDEANINMDASLGFAEMYGYRNNYRLPFKPYNWEAGIAYDFIEVPMNLMDATFWEYLGYSSGKTLHKILDFIQTNRENAVISILFHNEYLTGFTFKEYLEVYKGILAHMHETGIKSVTARELIEQFKY